MVDFFKSLFKSKKAEQTPIISVNDLEPTAYNGVYSQYSTLYDGDKFPGGFGPLQVIQNDYWALRERSEELFTNNMYAAGLIRRLITNEINAGLSPEAIPDEQILGVPDDSLNDWTEMTENRFGLWGKNPKMCDWYQLHTFGALQRMARMEALIGGDCLVILRYSKVTGLPSVQLVKGAKVVTPLTKEPRNGNDIKHGVEIDKNGRHVAYWVKQTDGDIKRVPAFGEKSGRRVAWMIYGADRRFDDVRGRPLLSLVLQSLKEIDRYRDSAQRKAVINSILAMFIKKTEDKPGTLPIQGGAVRRDVTTTTDGDGKQRNFNIASHLPGLVLEELQTGEDVVLKGGDGTDTNFPVFEEAIIQAFAWVNEVPPEILRLAFSNNYSASQAAINEFRIYQDKIWSEFGECFCTPIYTEWTISEALTRRTTMNGFLEAWRDPNKYDIYGAWLSVEWQGNVKPSTDRVKQGKGSQLAIELGLSTHAREARINHGTKFSKNAKRLKRENELLAEARRPLLELEREFSGGENDVDR